MGKHQGRGLAVWQISEPWLSLDVNCSSREQMSVVVLCPEQRLQDVPAKGCEGCSPTHQHLPEGLDATGNISPKQSWLVAVPSRLFNWSECCHSSRSFLLPLMSEPVVLAAFCV